MKFNWKDVKPRNILTILAEIATILSLLLAWVMYKDSQATTSTPLQPISPIMLAFVVVNAVMFLFLSFSIVRALLIHLNGKQYRLTRKFDAFSKSPSKYLTDMNRNKENAYKALIERTKKALKSLDDSLAFDEDVYYMLLFSLFFAADGPVNVVSILDDNEWIDSPEEDEFLRVNLSLVDKHIHLNRIFVVDNAEAAKTKLNTKSIQSFIESDHTYVHIFVVFRDKLSRNIINDIGSGFIEFYDFVVACDIFADNEIRGTLKTDIKEVERYNKLYMKLTEYYQPLNQEFAQLYFSTTSPTEKAAESFPELGQVNDTQAEQPSQTI